MPDRQESAACLLQGRPPEDDNLLAQLSVGLDSLTDFLRDKYLKSYIPQGGSKIKFITGRQGCGKTHLSRLLAAMARREGYITVRFSARDVLMNDFKAIYLEIMRQCPLSEIFAGCASRIVADLGYDPADIPPGARFVDYLAERGESDMLIKNELRGALRAMFIRNPRLDNCFAGCCSLLTGDALGHPVLEASGRDVVTRWLVGDKTLRQGQLRAMGITPASVTKYNARYLLRSLQELIHLAGRPGLVVVIDDMEALVSPAGESGIRYTKMRRDDTYESIRQLIDDIDAMRHCLFLLCFDRALMDDENAGMKSYQALWMRIQNEVLSPRFNRFADIIDLDRYGDEYYTPAVLQDMSLRLSDALGDESLAPLSQADIAHIMERAQYGGVGLMYLVNQATVKGVLADE